MLTPILTSVLIFIVGLVVICTIGAILITHIIPKEDRIALRIITQPTLTVTGMMFSVLLGFFIAQSLRDTAQSINRSSMRRMPSVKSSEMPGDWETRIGRNSRSVQILL